MFFVLESTRQPEGATNEAQTLYRETRTRFDEAGQRALPPFVVELVVAAVAQLPPRQHDHSLSFSLRPRLSKKATTDLFRHYRPKPIRPLAREFHRSRDGLKGKKTILFHRFPALQLRRDFILFQIFIRCQFQLVTFRDRLISFFSSYNRRILNPSNIAKDFLSFFILWENISSSRICAF
jgi:hypothetical protein